MLVQYRQTGPVRITDNQLATALGAWRRPGAALARALADAVGEAALDGRLRVGSRLPAERRAAAALGVSRGTVIAARHAAERTKAKKLVSVAGGGDTVAALNQAGVAHDFSYISTAGGAFLEWMEGKPLPGVEVLKKQ